MYKKSRKSASKWEQASERALLAIWADNMEKLRGCRKNSHILAEMAVEMEKQGFFYGVEELKTKMHNMTSRYRKEKQKVGTTGGSPSEWEFYEEFKNLFAYSKSHNTENLVQDSINDINSIIEVTPEEFELPSTSGFIVSTLPPTDVCPSSPLPSLSKPKSRKKDDLLNILTKVEKNVEKMQEEMRKTSENIIKIEEEKKNMLREYIDREAEVQKALVDFLKR